VAGGTRTKCDICGKIIDGGHRKLNQLKKRNVTLIDLLSLPKIKEKPYYYSSKRLAMKFIWNTM
jgi:hypothetical protein